MQQRTDTGTTNLEHLNDLDDYKVAEGEPDIRGWEVRNREGTRLGTVSDLLVDTGLMKARYIEVELDEPARRREGNPYTLVPIGAAELRADDNQVLVDVETARLAGLPRHAQLQRFTREHETAVIGCYRYAPEPAGTAAGSREADFYSGGHFDDRRLRGDRTRDEGYLARREPSAGTDTRR